VALLFMLAALGPGFVARVLGLAAEDTGYVLAPAGLGIILTTLFLGHYGATMSRTRLVSGGLLAMALTLAALALMRGGTEAIVGELGRRGITDLPLPGFVSYLGAVELITFLLGVEFTLVTIPAQTVIVEHTDEALRGRVFSALFMLISLLSAAPVTGAWRGGRPATVASSH
jgi:MFS family permease